MTLLTLDPQDPQRPPNWRWQRVVEWQAAPHRPFRRCTDLLERAARRFWHGWQTCPGDPERRRLALSMPEVSNAFAFASAPGGRSRHAIEARLLAGQAPAAIAQKSATTPGVIECYAGLYFDVQDRLGSPDYILHEVLASPQAEGVPWTVDRVWKFFGYLGGAEVLDEIMQARAPGRQPSDPFEVAQFLAEHARASMRQKMAIATRAVAPADPRLARELLRMQGQLESRQDKAAGAAPDNSLLLNLDAALKALPFGVRRPGQPSPGRALAGMADAAAEPRADDLLLATLGMPPADLARLRNITFPEPPAR